MYLASFMQVMRARCIRRGMSRSAALAGSRASREHFSSAWGSPSEGSIFTKTIWVLQTGKGARACAPGGVRAAGVAGRLRPVREGKGLDEATIGKKCAQRARTLTRAANQALVLAKHG